MSIPSIIPAVAVVVTAVIVLLFPSHLFVGRLYQRPSNCTEDEAGRRKGSGEERKGRSFTEERERRPVGVRRLHLPQSPLSTLLFFQPPSLHLFSSPRWEREVKRVVVDVAANPPFLQVECRLCSPFLTTSTSFQRRVEEGRGVGGEKTEEDEARQKMFSSSSSASSSIQTPHSFLLKFFFFLQSMKLKRG